MVYAVFPEPEEVAPHPRLEPVSAWLFRGRSPFLRAAGLRKEDTSLFTMPIDAGGFNPETGDPDRPASDVWRHYVLSGMIFDQQEQDHYFSAGSLEANLDLVSDDVPNPRVYVLPLPNDSINGDPARDPTRARPDIGSPIASSADLPDTPPRAIVGIIDHDINIFHRRFRTGPDRTRIIGAWIQGAAWQNARLPFGHEWTKREIDRALVRQGSDEDALLRHLGATSERRTASHGTHVLDLAAGMAPNDPRGSTHPIIAVALPSSVTRETSGSMLALPFAMGLEYILDRARRYMAEMPEPPPVFINVSFGLSGGPRGGMHRLEQTIHRVIDRHLAILGRTRAHSSAGPTPRVFVAAGNRNRARGYARSAPGAADLTVVWHLQPGDRTSNFLEFRIETQNHRAPGPIAVTLRPPNTETALHTEIAMPDANQPTAWLLQRGDAVIGRLSAQIEPDQPAILTIALAQTDPGTGADIAAPAGDWQITVATSHEDAARIDASILRDDGLPGFRDNALQSFLVDPTYQARDERGFPVDSDDGTAQTVRRRGSLNALATGPEPDVPDAVRIETIGAYQGRSSVDLTASGYSASPDPDHGESISASAQADRSSVLQGVRAAGTRNHVSAVINGTSVAAPQVLRQHVLEDSEWLDVNEDDSDPRLGHRILAPRMNSPL